MMQHLWWGNYGISALTVSLEHCLAGKKAKSKFLNNSIMSKTPNSENSYQESQEEVAVFEMKQRIALLRKQGLPESPM